MKIIIISRTILPTIAPRAYRATELAKALAKKGHNVKLMAVLGQYDYTTFEKETGVKVQDIGTPFIATRNSDGKLKLSLWKLGLIFFLRKLFEFPDILLVGKIKNAILKEDNFDILITVAVPYTIHWGVSLIKKSQWKFQTWISDCGDPYMGNDMGKHFFYFKYIEKWWSRKTNYITIPVVEACNSYYPEFRHKIRIIPQGFDFSKVKNEEYKENDIPTFLYAGALYKEKRDPKKFLEFLVNLEITFKFIIYTSHTIHFQPFIDILKDKLELRPLIDREILMKEMSKMDFLINISNKGSKAQVPSKLIDYALTKRPILEISSDFTEKEKAVFEAFLRRDYSGQLKIENLNRYNIDIIADQFLNLHTINR